MVNRCVPTPLSLPRPLDASIDATDNRLGEFWLPTSFVGPAVSANLAPGIPAPSSVPLSQPPPLETSSQTTLHSEAPCSFQRSTPSAEHRMPSAAAVSTLQRIPSNDF